jgi:hypothetical protein
MTTDKPIDVANFITTFMDGAYSSMKRAFDGLAEEQLQKQPTADTNSMVWLAWHANRWQDKQSAQAVGEDEVWVSGGWHDKFGMPADRSGIGDTLEQVAEFKPSQELLWGYIDAAHQAFTRRVESMSAEDLAKNVDYIPGRGDPRPVWRTLMGACSDTFKHTGQIEYIRGMLTGKGWFPA